MQPATMRIAGTPVVPNEGTHWSRRDDSGSYSFEQNLYHPTLSGILDGAFRFARFLHAPTRHNRVSLIEMDIVVPIVTGRFGRRVVKVPTSKPLQLDGTR